ncbi:TIGR04282 family arsenosugar biosynthesis glycosyltransferase [Desulfobacula sp.]|uniref:TIGR04282 family arsenosugar biosynthesis glycosyltransferase n=1 Tax=Desulfobacula sp. TaxID=2593537 RepID=UPI00261C17DF|nr:TIGR04282 family arsenosugar biosynthesis glycosyltransferase [Desulfobacula sp.]
MTSKAVIVFLKAPETGRVKTRLSQSLNTTFVLDLYKGFVVDTLDVLESAQDTFLYVWPPGKAEALQKWLGSQYLFCPQQGEDLGQRMGNAFADIFKRGYDAALLVGTDIPELTPALISRAETALQTTDAVIGPSSDGGYYLIGFQKSGFSTSVFKDIDWSTPAVLDQTRQAMNHLSLRYELLTEMDDIDTPEDLNALMARVKKGGTIGMQTLKVLTLYADGYIHYHTGIK